MYGVSGPFWYGAGATFQIFMFALAGESFQYRERGEQSVCEVGTRSIPPDHANNHAEAMH